jgi:hypothetical protein
VYIISKYTLLSFLFQTKYDEEVKVYLQMTGLKSSDLNKPKVNRKKDTSASNAKKANTQPAAIPQAETQAHNGVQAASGHVWSGNPHDNATNNFGQVVKYCCCYMTARAYDRMLLNLSRYNS